MSYKPSNMNYYTEINTYENGERANKSVFNRPIAQLADNIEYLKNRMDTVQDLYDDRYELKIRNKQTGFNLPVATDADIHNGLTVGKLARADDPRFLENSAPKEHTHSITDIIPDTLADNVFLFASGGRIIGKLPTVGWDNILNKPNYFPTDVSLVQGLSGLLTSYSSSGHTHGINDIRNLDSILTSINNSINVLSNQANTYAPKVHTHEITELRATNSPNGYLLYVNGNQISATPPPDPNATLPLNGTEGQYVKFVNSKVVWGGIAINDVADLQTTLNGKAPIYHTHSLTSIKVPDGSNGKFLFVDNTGNISLISGPGQGGFTPDEFVATIDVNLTANTGNVYYIDIPNTRLLGVSVKTSGVVKNLQVELLGQDASDVQYLSVFTDTLTEDVAQGWRFRDRTGTGKMRVRITNKDVAAFTGVVKITAEPF